MSWAKRPRFLIVAALVIVAGRSLRAGARADGARRPGRRTRQGRAREGRATHQRPQTCGAARADLLEARLDFEQMRNHLSSMGPLAPLARVTPFVRVQIRGANDFAQAGELLSDAGLRLVDAADRGHRSEGHPPAPGRRARRAPQRALRVERRHRGARRRGRQDPGARRLSPARPARRRARRPEGTLASRRCPRGFGARRPRRAHRHARRVRSASLPGLVAEPRRGPSDGRLHRHLRRARDAQRAHGRSTGTRRPATGTCPRPQAELPPAQAALPLAARLAAAAANARQRERHRRLLRRREAWPPQLWRRGGEQPVERRDLDDAGGDGTHRRRPRARSPFPATARP